MDIGYSKNMGMTIDELITQLQSLSEEEKGYPIVMRDGRDYTITLVDTWIAKIPIGWRNQQSVVVLERRGGI